ncbi:hypothetical protein NOR_03282 [Metarhizium rileyi]|uniref:Uncharacterized protein n=1 Tax=Metarhizium rileyi (strain RCEF 4871) TaxID=1649241 RepID=A0A162JQ82_METRR|nr:hypothetical protein NOR_03282 [Metarhizium rileyi RCEF 4871]TWU78367.1 hypothetical protein ED733_008675 [Metarhizium rileyi]
MPRNPCPDMPLLFFGSFISSCDHERFVEVVQDLCFSEAPILLPRFDMKGSAMSRGIVCGTAGRELSSSDILCLSPPALLARELAILATLSFLMTVEADVPTRRSLLDRLPIPEKGKTSRLQTSAKMTSKRARSLRGGARNAIRALAASNE